MVTGKPDDKKEPARVQRSGHGAASLIPHLRRDSALAQPEAGDAASTPEPQGLRPPDGAAQPPAE